MSPTIVVETRHRPVVDWRLVCKVSEDDPPGSMSSHEPTGRQMLLFGWIDGTGPCVWRSVLGIDQEVGDGRWVDTAALERLADLAAGPYERDIVLPGERKASARWRLDV